MAETGAITKAADLLNVAQPALGLQIRQLEQELRIELLRRHSRGVELTDAGETFLTHSVRILRNIDCALLEMRGLSEGSQELLSLGLTPSIMLQIGPDLLIDAKKKMPSVSVSLTEELSHGLVLALGRGEINFAFAYGVDQPQPGVERRAILEEEILFIRPAMGHCLPKTITFEQALAHELVQAGERDMVQNLLKVMAEKLSVDLKIVYEAQSIPAMRELVVRGVAASFMPYGTAIEELRAGKVVMQRISDIPLKRTLYFLKSTNKSAFREQAEIDSFLDSVAERLFESLGTLARRIRA